MTTPKPAPMKGGNDMSQETLTAREEVEQGLLKAIQKAISDNKAEDAEKWSHAYVQFRQGLGLAPQN